MLDVSDPTNIRHVGQFDMNQAHYATHVPALIEMPDGRAKHVAIASHEEPDERFDQRSGAVDRAIYKTPHPNKTNPNSTGTVFLVDCEGIYPEDPGDARSPGDGPTQLGELDNWTWKNVDTGQGFGGTPASEISAEEHRARLEAIQQPEFSFQLSPHNSEVAMHTIDGEETVVVHQGHYHGGARYLAVDPGTDDGLTGDAWRDYRPFENPFVEGRDGSERFGWINTTTDWALTDIGHARPTNETTGDLSPDVWGSVERNGVTFSADRGAGVYATHHDAIPVTRGLPVIGTVGREDDGDLFTVGQTNRVDLTVETFERRGADSATVTVRDRVPSDYEVVGGDAVETYPEGVRTAVEFESGVAPGETKTLTYFVRSSEDTQGNTFGPVEVSPDGVNWLEIAGTVDTQADVGADTEL